MKNCLFEDPVFKSETDTLSIHQMKKILKTGDAQSIRNMFFCSQTIPNLNLSHVVELQIKKHARVLNHGKSKMLRYLLKQLKHKGQVKYKVDDEATNYKFQKQERQIEKYLTFNEGLEFYSSLDLH